MQKPLERAANLETTALGAAFLAGLAVGYWQDTAELKQLFAKDQRFEAQMTPAKSSRLYAGWQRAVKATRIFTQKD